MSEIPSSRIENIDDRLVVRSPIPEIPDDRPRIRGRRTNDAAEGIELLDDPTSGEDDGIDEPSEGVNEPDDGIELHDEGMNIIGAMTKEPSKKTDPRRKEVKHSTKG